MSAIEYRKQAEQKAQQNGTNLTAEIYRIAGKMSVDELVALGVELNHRRLTKTAQRINESTGREQRTNRSEAEDIAVSYIEAAQE